MRVTVYVLRYETRERSGRCGWGAPRLNPSVKIKSPHLTECLSTIVTLAINPLYSSGNTVRILFSEPERLLIGRPGFPLICLFPAMEYLRGRGQLTGYIRI